jgi:hypothetical protein
MLMDQEWTAPVSGYDEERSLLSLFAGNGGQRGLKEITAYLPCCFVDISHLFRSLSDLARFIAVSGNGSNALQFYKG